MASSRSSLLINEVTKNKFVWLALLLCISLLLIVYAVPQMRLALGLASFSINIWFVSIGAGLLPLVVVQVYRSIMERRPSR